MIDVKLQPVLHRLAAVEQAMKKRQDEEHHKKMVDLMRKVARGEWVIAFCGHFSAGKSSMLNELYGEQLLPTSPIPTSANVVKIMAGRDQVTLYLNTGEIHRFAGTYTEQELKALCKNGEEVLAVHVERQTAALPERVALLDTPGVDSADDAHQAVTLSALHLADAIFYMMDYNHVQSEGNLSFIKQLMERKEQVYLIINQIDKHRDAELPFRSYQASVEKTFAEWGIHPQGVFYTSLADRSHPYNQLAECKALIHQLMRGRDRHLEESVRKEALYLIHEHVSWLRLCEQEERKRLEEKRLKPTPPHGRSLGEWLDECEAGLSELDEQSRREREEWVQGLNALLKNAYLMPAYLRELARNYLETVLTPFKVGLLFSGKKTEQEKERRRQAFYEQLRQTVETQLEVHLKTSLMQFAKERQLDTEAMGEAIYQPVSWISPDMLAQVIKPGAEWSGAYVLTYTEDLAQAIKKRAREWAETVYARMKEERDEQVQAKKAGLAAQINEIRQAMAAEHQLATMEQERAAYLETLLKIVEGAIEVTESDLSSLLIEDIRSAQQRYEVKPAEEPTEVGDELIEWVAKPIEASQAAGRTSQVLHLVEQAERWLQELPGFAQLRQEWREKRARIAEKQYTVALFGAFSAGKSSFANALLGNRVLPVSPHPTTATIHRISPPTDQHAHGEAVIRFKSRDALFHDLKQVYALFHREVESLDEAISGIGKLLQEPTAYTKQKLAIPFLRAIQQGYGGLAAELGGEKVVSQEECEAFVANEAKSAFVESVTLHYDAPLTRQGITIVDTPGADSIHARHTEVAFQYIKNSDAIIYVTYFNHPFSRADREFLIQLGRVKDVFSLDKMFFVINAADLASSEAELTMVQQYIESQLQQYGIRQPRLFALSSLQALAEPHDERMARFERSFLSFILHDLTEVSLNQLGSEVKRAERMLEQMGQTLKQSKAEQEANRLALADEREALERIIRTSGGKAEEQALEQELNELIYYVKQRLFYRYHDVFTEIFNPSALREDGQVKEKLQGCVWELVEFIKHDLLQEMRATALRMEKWMTQAQGALAETIAERCRTVRPQFQAAFTSEGSVPSPALTEPFADLTLTSFKKSLGLFKNAKAFFEKGEKVHMETALKEVLEQAVTTYLEKSKAEWKSYYVAAWQEAVEQVKRALRHEVVREYEWLEQGFDEALPLDVFMETKRQFARVSAELNKVLAE
ncbi:dynamin family protein [Laceyella putida]|uniref:Dynamin family protein n=1 Tax=Laceyella putida TaxID=110101 RepID=A0ABW2RML4_9BACL